MSIFAEIYNLPSTALWVLSSLFRPFCVVSLILVVSNPTAALRKFELFVTTFQYLLFCKDKKWKTPEDPAPYFEKVTSNKIEQKTILFVRHGESTWNDTFNKGDRSTAAFVLNFVPNLLKAIAYELYFWIAGQADESWFYDAPLSDKGLNQAKGVRGYLQSKAEFLPPKEAKYHALLWKDSQLVSSNLRRAISTMMVGFQDRLKSSDEKDTVLILPALQEISFNPDALSITPAKGKVTPAWTDPLALRKLYSKVDTTMHTGNKAVTSNGLLRLEEFSKICFEDISKDTIVAAGHSLWFRSFFRTYLPHSLEHISKKKKLVNGGIVGFTFQRTKTEKGEWKYLVEAKSIEVLHGGF